MDGSRVIARDAKSESATRKSESASAGPNRDAGTWGHPERKRVYWADGPHGRSSIGGDPHGEERQAALR